MENFINVALIAGAACLFIMINRRVFKKNLVRMKPPTMCPLINNQILNPIQYPWLPETV